MDWLAYVFGDVGDGIFAWLGEFDGCDPPPIDWAVR